MSPEGVLRPRHPTLHPRRVNNTAVVTVVRGEHDQLEKLHESLDAGRPVPDLLVVVAVDASDLITWVPDGGVPVEVIPMSATADGPPLSVARNAGAVVALEHGADVLVFLDEPLVAGSAPLTITRKVWGTLGGFDEHTGS